VIANDPYIGAQVLTAAIPLGTFCVAVLVAFFLRRRDT
jgi:hypothetical protein